MYEIQGLVHSDNWPSLLERDVISILWVNSHIHILFPIHTGLAISLFFSSAWSSFQKFVTLPCQQSVLKASLGSAFTISSPGWVLSRLPWLHKLSELVSFSLCRSIWLRWFDDAINKLPCHYFTFTCLTSAPQQTSRQENPPSPNHRFKNQELHNITKSLLLC